MQRDLRGELARSMDAFREVSKATAAGLQSIESMTPAVKQGTFDKLNLTVDVLEQRDVAWLESIGREFDRDLCTRMCARRKKPAEP